MVTDDRPALTDYGNAERLVIWRRGDLRYCYAWAKWLVWDTMRYRVDDAGTVERYAKETVRAIYEEANEAVMSGDSQAKDIARHAAAFGGRCQVA